MYRLAVYTVIHGRNVLRHIHRFKDVFGVADGDICIHFSILALSSSAMILACSSVMPCISLQFNLGIAQHHERIAAHGIGFLYQRCDHGRVNSCHVDPDLFSLLQIHGVADQIFGQLRLTRISMFFLSFTAKLFVCLTECFAPIYQSSLSIPPRNGNYCKTMDCAI